MNNGQYRSYLYRVLGVLHNVRSLLQKHKSSLFNDVTICGPDQPDMVWLPYETSIIGLALKAHVSLVIASNKRTWTQI
jgi:hypothetical protein